MTEVHSVDAPAHASAVPYDPRESWPEPDERLLNGGKRPAPEFPLDCLGPLASWAADLAASKGAPVDYVAAPLLAFGGAATGAARAVCVRPGWVEPCILWVSPAGAPSAGKSPSLLALKRSIAEIEREETGDDAERRREHEARKVEAEALREEWKRSAQEAVKQKRAAPPMPADAEEPEEPRMHRLHVADATTEKLARIIAENPRGVICIRDELAGLIGNLGKYGGDDAPFYLSAYNGDFSPVDRVKGGTITAARANLCIVGGIQPDKMQMLLSGRANDGLVSRFLFVWPDAAPSVWNVPDADEGRAVVLFRRLRSLQMDTSETGELIPRVLPLSPAAGEIFAAWWKEQKEKCEESAGFMAEFLGKSLGMCARVALVLELLDWAAGSNGSAEGPREVAAGAVERACRLFADYFEPMAARVYGDAALPDAERKAVALLKEILRRTKGRQQRGPFVFNARAAQRKWGVPGLSDVSDINAALGVLLDCDCVREVQRENKGPGRKAKDYLVNPHLTHAGAG